MSTANQQLQHCLTQTKALLVEAQAQHWEALETGLQQRDRQLQQALVSAGDPGQPGDTAKTRELIEAIRELDSQLMVLVSDNRSRVLQMLKNSNQGQKMKAAYRQTKRPY